MMNRHRGMASAVGAAAVWGAAALVVAGAAGAWAVPATRGAVPAATSWGRAIAVPGLRALNEGHHAVVRSVSCGSAGNCAAGGNYRDRLGHGQGFVVSETNGRWSPAIKVPGLPALNKGQQSRVVSVSCASAGNCVAGGYYRDRSRGYQSFVVNESNGVWRRAIEVPGLRTLNTAGKGETSSVSCASAGNCAAVGYYGGRSGIRGFVVSEQHGRWRRAIAVPGLTALAAGGSSEVISVSCASAGNCAVGGHYGYKHQKPEQGFVASEHNGVWGHAIEVPGLSALNRDFVAGVRSMSCASAGNCAAVGGYTDSRGRRQGFVASEHNGVWGHAIEVPGLSDLSKGRRGAGTSSVSCSSAGNCAAVGGYVDGQGHAQGFVASEHNGVWRRAIRVPGLSALNIGGDARVVWVSCASAGNCAAVGGYADGHGHGQGFVIIERQGAWHRAIKVPGLGALNTGGDAGFRAVSCVSPWTCAAGGYYAKRSGHLHYQGFVSRS
jgi:hypothetical protein